MVRERSTVIAFSEATAGSSGAAPAWGVDSGVGGNGDGGVTVSGLWMLPGADDATALADMPAKARGEDCALLLLRMMRKMTTAITITARIKKRTTSTPKINQAAGIPDLFSPSVVS
jgi:hypothetical protein